MSQPQSKDALGPQGQKGQYPSSLQNQQQPYYQGQGQQQQQPTGAGNSNSSIFSNPQYLAPINQTNQPYVAPSTQPQTSGPQFQGQQNQWQGNQPTTQQSQFQQNQQNPPVHNSGYTAQQSPPVQAPLSATQTYPNQQGAHYGEQINHSNNTNQQGSHNQQGGYNQPSNYQQQGNYNQQQPGNFNQQQQPGNFNQQQQPGNFNQQQQPGNFNQQQGNFNQQQPGNFNQQTGNFNQQQPGNLNQSSNFQNPQQPPFQQGNQGPIQANFNQPIQPNQPVQPTTGDKQQPTKEAESPKKDKDKKKKEKEEKQKKQKQQKEKKQKEKKEKEKKEKQEKDKKEKEKKGEKGEKGDKEKTAQKGDGKLVLQQNLVEQIPKDLTGPQILAFMKKKPYTQKIGNTEFTYSVLSKKQQSFLGSNTRFLFLKGNESLSYAREFSDKTPLPFIEESQIPKAKTTYLIPQIESVTNEQEKLIVNFAGEKKVKWEFVCPSKDCSLKWRKKIEAAKQFVDEFKTSGVEKYEDFVRQKEARAQFAQNQQQNAANNLMNPNANYNPNFAGNFGGNSPNKNNPQNNNQFNPNQQYNQNQQYNPNPQYNPQPNQNPNKPNSVLFQGPQAEKIDNFISDRSSEQRAYLNQSMSRMPIEQREGIRTDIRRNRRNWIQQLIGGQEQVELLLQFKNYIQRIAEVIVNQLYVSQDVKMYPATESTKDSACYVIDDISIEVYFFNEDNLSNKHHRYRSAVQEFKNFEYLINTTKNQGILKVPLMTMFEYKGFVGMAKSNLGESRAYKNKEFYDIINRKEFQEITRISAESLLNQAKCKIVSYDRPNIGGKFSTQFNKVYFVERLAEFLPLESSKEFGPNPNHVLRAELVNAEEFEEQVFRDRVRLIKPEKVGALVEGKIDELVRVLENEENYFTSSQELAELVHLYGINMRYLGVIYKKVKLTWLKRILQAEIAARCLKNYFRLDMQSSILQTYDQTNRKERQEERERHKVVSFLNIVFGNTEPTFRLWRNLNSSAIEKYHTKIWDNEFTDINTGYLLQAIQNHFKILLAGQVVDRKVFKGTATFDPRDFIRFDFDFSIYNLDFTNIFDQIHQSLQEETLDSFQSLCEILTKQTSTRMSYLDLLRSHPIHDRISQFLLNFTSPAENGQLYNKIESKYLPHKFLYESKFAEIKWYLKFNKQDHITRATNFIQEHVRKWLGQVHPLMIQLYRMLAEYFSENQFYYTRALQYANDSLKLQRTLFEGDSEPIWRDYYLVGKIHFINSRSDDALTYLSKAKALVKPQKLTEYQSYGELCLMLAKGYFGAKYYKQSYTTVRELYKIIKQQRDQRSLTNIVQAVTLIKQLLQINQQHQSYYKFVESDFSNIVYAFADYPSLMIQSIKMITIPYLKNVILRNSKNKVRLLNIIEEISKIKQSPTSCQAYIKAKISQGTFPKSYLHCLKEIDSVIDEILANQMIERWKSFNNLANQSILDKIGNSQINRGFDFLANMTALFNLLGQEVLEELFIMEK